MSWLTSHIAAGFGDKEATPARYNPLLQRAKEEALARLKTEKRPKLPQTLSKADIDRRYKEFRNGDR